MSLIDSQLYRNLQVGTAYEGLIPAYNHTDFPFDKTSDNSNTYDTLKFMSVWANKYAHQMKKVAPLLKGVTLQETVNKIYAFLYSHFQYKLDGETQNLMSPSAAWHFRKTGFDCKTYSILASTILQNLGIPHAFRMVQQAGIMPGEWSHVYVVVPNGNQELIIDATTHTNKQVSYTQKHDYTMKHRGLASPYVGALGCTCQGTPITKSGLGSPGTLANTIKNFHAFLNELEKQGISREVTNRMLSLVQYNVSKGINPNMSDVMQKALASQKGLGFTITPISTLTAAPMTGFSLPKMQTSIPSGNNVTPGTSVFSQFQTSATAAATSGASGFMNKFQINGIPVTSMARAATGDPTAIAEINKVIMQKLGAKTWTQVFANGFDLSCWNSAYSESKAKIDLEKDLPYIVNWSGVYTKPTTESLDRFMFITEIYMDHAKDGQASKYAKCTRKGSAMREKGVLELRKNILQEFTYQGFQLIPNGKKNNRFDSSLPGKTDTSTVYKTAKNGYDSYTVIPPAQAQTQAQGQTQNNGAATTTDANGNVIPAPVSTKTASISPIAIGGALLLGLKLLL